MSTADGREPHPASSALASLSACELSRDLERGRLSSAEAVQLFLARIEALDKDGPRLNSVLQLAPDATRVAAERDAERAKGLVRGPMHGLPVLVKDNVDTIAPLSTTAGSLIFEGTSPVFDAPLVASLRDAGAVVIGKTNLSEWANFRGRPSASGWSAMGGQTLNPHALDRSPGGSSAGSGSAVAAGLAPLAVGTETDGSIICPAAACGIVGLKPTVGLVSRAGIVPISSSQDTAGPMARTVEDVALLLEVLAGAAAGG
ncbi:MAG: amidase family protein, partial [Acidimicrobiales bacterium]